MWTHDCVVVVAHVAAVVVVAVQQWHVTKIGGSSEYSDRLVADGCSGGIVPPPPLLLLLLLLVVVVVVAAVLDAISWLLPCINDRLLLCPGCSTTGARANCSLRTRISNTCLLSCSFVAAAMPTQPVIQSERNACVRCNVANPV